MNDFDEEVASGWPGTKPASPGAVVAELELALATRVLGQIRITAVLSFVALRNSPRLRALDKTEWGNLDPRSCPYACGAFPSGRGGFGGESAPLECDGKGEEAAAERPPPWSPRSDRPLSPPRNLPHGANSDHNPTDRQRKQIAGQQVSKARNPTPLASHRSQPDRPTSSAAVIWSMNSG